eukprot:850945-Pleurochrysis_carterae.AAC.1
MERHRAHSLVLLRDSCIQRLLISSIQGQVEVIARHPQVGQIFKELIWRDGCDRQQPRARASGRLRPSKKGSLQQDGGGRMAATHARGTVACPQKLAPSVRQVLAHAAHSMAR